jgi:leucyl aminopeptidase
MSTVHPVPEFDSSIARPDTLDVDLLVIPVFGSDDKAAELVSADKAVGGEWERAIAAKEFRHKPYAGVALRVVSPGWKARYVYFLGAGAVGEANAERLRRLGSTAGHVARQRGAASVGFVVRGGVNEIEAAGFIADGLSAAEFDGGTYKRAADRPGPPASRVVIAVPGGDAAQVENAVRRGRIIGESANFARGLANEPGNVLTPTEFAARVAQSSHAVGLEVDILDEDRIRELNMGLLLCVSQGSAEPARLMVIRHDPPGAPKTPVLAFVGKGVTFDSGGISIKPADMMDRMKDDMSGGAAVAAALRALAILETPTRVIGLIPTVENMPGGRATRPGDVITGASGTTVEIINTDAEGRLILADALWYARQLGATHLVDIATLTGAIVVALGRTVTGLFGSPDAWVNEVQAAATRAGDRVWPMPIYEEAGEQLRSEIADIVNSAGRPGGSVTAAAFLREFAAGLPWAHLDIAGTAWAEDRTPYQPKGATGVAVRTLIELAADAQKRQASGG